MNRKLNFKDLHDLKQSDIIDYFSFYTKTGDYIPDVVSVELNKYGQFGTITCNGPDYEEPITYGPEEYDFTRETVFVLGVGYLIPGDIVRLHLLDKRYYEVQYGWHTNVSNQTIHSWYLVPVNYDEVRKEVVYRTDSNILTLYKEYLDTIEVVDFKKNRSSFYVGGEPNNG
jgi:hypothetical protein